MIHYHGTPITPRSSLDLLAGKHFCVSYARPENAQWCIQNGQSVMWDNGAFSAYTRGAAFDEAGYYEWLQERLWHPHWAVVPDVIDGSVEEQRQLVSRWPFDRFLSAPVWHIHLPVDYLIELCDQWPRVCFGSSGEYWKIGTAKWCKRIDEAFAAIDRAGLKPWIHMLRAMTMASKGWWPFASADSTNVARNHKNKGREKCPKLMADMIDARQPNTTFTLRSKP